MKQKEIINSEGVKKYRVSIKRGYGAVKWGSCLDVENVDELRQALREKGSTHVELTYYTYFDDDMHYEKRTFPLENLSDNDFLWLIEKTGYDSRSIMY